MKAIAYHRYGPPDVLECEEVEKPTPGDDEVLIGIRAASVNPADWHCMRGEPRVVRVGLGLRGPKSTRPGVDVAGEVEAVGGKVTRFQPGDGVFGMCRGSFAEHACARESSLVKKPGNVTFEQAAATPMAGVSALQSLRDKGRLQPGQQVLINGAAGGVGTFAVQIAKALGGDVAGVCSTRNVDLVRSLGADRVLDYTRDDFTTQGARYDLIVDCVGNHPLLACKRVLAPGGICVLVGGTAGRWIDPLPRVLAALVLSSFGSRKLVGFLARGNNEDMTILADLMEARKVTPVIDRRYGLGEVSEAMRYLEGGHARGKVVITIGPGRDDGIVPAIERNPAS